MLDFRKFLLILLSTILLVVSVKFAKTDRCSYSYYSYLLMR